MASISIPTLPSLCHKKIHFSNPPFLVSFTPTPITSAFTSYPTQRPKEALMRRWSPQIRASVIAQSSSDLDGAEEEEGEMDVMGGRGGSDWGQQEEVSDDDAQRGVGEEGREGFPLPPEDAKLFVGNLPFDVDSEGLAGVFLEAGVVEVAEIIYNRGTDQSRGFGFVTMSTVEEAEKAMEMFNGYELNGRSLVVNKAARRGSQPTRNMNGFVRGRRIFVGNLPWQVDDARLEEVFAEHGKVVEARVVYEKDSGRSRGFGFVKMSTDQEIDDAIAYLDGKDVDGRPIRVGVAEERPPPRRSYQ